MSFFLKLILKNLTCIKILIKFFIVFHSHSGQMFDWHFGYNYLHIFITSSFTSQGLQAAICSNIIFCEFSLHTLATKYHLFLLTLLHNITLCRVYRIKFPNFTVGSKLWLISCLAFHFYWQFSPHYRCTLQPHQPALFWLKYSNHLHIVCLSSVSTNKINSF
jgi:hypothetical protein